MNSAHRKMNLLLKRIYKNKFFYLLLVPFIAFIIVFKYFPIYGITLAFKDFKIRKGIIGSPWAGLKYFKQLFESYSFWQVFANTVIISLEKLVFCFPAPIILALFINEIRSEKAKKTFQTFTYLPHFISWIIAAAFINDLCSLNGPINTVLASLGLKKVYFLADTRSFRGLLVISQMWKNSGWSAIIYVAAIAGISPELYEAAMIDGAGKMQRIWHVTLPCIKSTIITLFILDIGKLMNAGFEQIFNLYSPSVYSVADIIDTYTYRQGLINTNFSYATAAGLSKNIVGFILVIISNSFVKRIGEEGALW